MSTPKEKSEINTSFGGIHLPYSAFSEGMPHFNFLDANIGRLDFGENLEELKYLAELDEVISKGCRAQHFTDLENVVRGILKKETSFDLEDYSLYVSSRGARGALIPLLSKTINGNKNKIAYASPNWCFDEIAARVEGAGRSPFYAFSSDSFVEGFSKLDDLDKVSSLIVVDPANPLGYRLNKEHVSELERVAEKHGIQIFFDDVFRGMQEEGNRHSSSEYSKNSIIIETTSKRFGSRGLGVTWSLVPKSLSFKFAGPVVGCNGCSAIASAVTNALYETKYGEKIRDHLIKNTYAFIEGTKSSFKKDETNAGSFVFAFEGMPIINYNLPSGKYKNLIELHQLAADLCGITSGANWVSHAKEYEPCDDETNLALSFFRICPTKENSERSFQAGSVLGFLVNQYR